MFRAAGLRIVVSRPRDDITGSHIVLSDRARPVIQATLPVVGEHIEEIAQRFYAHMFAAHPEFEDGMFNRGNQAEGSQPKALAGSVAVFAGTLLAVPEQFPDRLLTRIAHKHASLGIRPDQYPVVHDHLMWAIGEVLGDAVTMSGPSARVTVCPLVEDFTGRFSHSSVVAASARRSCGRRDSDSGTSVVSRTAEQAGRALRRA